MAKALRAGQDAPPTIFETSRCCWTNSLHERCQYADIAGGSIQNRAPRITKYISSKTRKEIYNARRLKI